MMYIVIAFVICILVKFVSARGLEVYIETGQTEDQLNKKLMYNAMVMGYLGSTMGYYMTLAIFLAYLVNKYVL